MLRYEIRYEKGEYYVSILYQTNEALNQQEYEENLLTALKAEGLKGEFHYLEQELMIWLDADRHNKAGLLKALDKFGDKLDAGNISGGASRIENLKVAIDQVKQRDRELLKNSGAPNCPDLVNAVESQEKSLEALVFPLRVSTQDTNKIKFQEETATIDSSCSIEITASTPRTRIVSRTAFEYSKDADKQIDPDKAYRIKGEELGSMMFVTKYDGHSLMKDQQWVQEHFEEPNLKMKAFNLSDDQGFLRSYLPLDDNQVRRSIHVVPDNLHDNLRAKLPEIPASSQPLEKFGTIEHCLKKQESISLSFVVPQGEAGKKFNDPHNFADALVMAAASIENAIQSLKRNADDPRVAQSIKINFYPPEPGKELSVFQKAVLIYCASKGCALRDRDDKDIQPKVLKTYIERTAASVLTPPTADYAAISNFSAKILEAAEALREDEQKKQVSTSTTSFSLRHSS